MSVQCRNSQYYSGQGSLALGTKDAVTGEITGGLRTVGNVSSLELGIAVTEFEHKESCSGARGVDLTLTTETNVSFNFTMESLNLENLALVLNGTSTQIAAGTVTDEPVVAAHDMWTMLANLNVEAVIITDDAGATTYTAGDDYIMDEASGMFSVLSSGAIAQGAPLLVDYTYGAQQNIAGFTSGANPIRWARFAGLNTADGDKPVLVDVYKVSVTPLATLALINDEIAQMAVSAKALADSTRLTGSKFFNVRMGA